MNFSAAFQGFPGIFGSSHASNTSPGRAGIIRSNLNSGVLFGLFITSSPFFFFLENTAGTDRGIRSRTARTRAPNLQPAEGVHREMKCKLRGPAFGARLIPPSRAASDV